MKNRKKISPTELEGNIFKMIGNDWMLVTASNAKGYNTMTASWGGVGILWNKPVCFVFIRPQRYTHEFTESGDKMTLSFFGGGYKKELGFCGRVSGRDEDKVSACYFSEIKEDGYVYFDQAETVVCAKKLYRGRLDECSFVDKSLLSNYTAGDYHTVYICEIESVLVTE